MLLFTFGLFLNLVLLSLSLSLSSSITLSFFLFLLSLSLSLFGPKTISSKLSSLISDIITPFLISFLLFLSPSSFLSFSFLLFSKIFFFFSKSSSLSLSLSLSLSCSVFSFFSSLFSIWVSNSFLGLFIISCAVLIKSSNPMTCFIDK